MKVNRNVWGMALWAACFGAAFEKSQAAESVAPVLNNAAPANVAPNDVPFVTDEFAGFSPEMREKLKALPKAEEAPLLEKPLQPGVKAPDFTLVDQSGKRQRLSDLRGKTVVLSFYPMDLTFSCTASAVSVSEKIPQIEKMDAVVFGISVQRVFSKVLMAGDFAVKFPLLADENQEVAKNYGVLNRDGLAGRVTFIIGPDGTILKTNEKVNGLTLGPDLVEQLRELSVKPVAPATQQQTQQTTQKD